jgi:hypothetical protein
MRIFFISLIVQSFFPYSNNTFYSWKKFKILYILLSYILWIAINWTLTIILIVAPIFLQILLSYNRYLMEIITILSLNIKRMWRWLDNLFIYNSIIILNYYRLNLHVTRLFCIFTINYIYYVLIYWYARIL